jgi:hypothetical protein
MFRNPSRQISLGCCPCFPPHFRSLPSIRLPSLFYNGEMDAGAAGKSCTRFPIRKQSRRGPTFVSRSRARKTIRGCGLRPCGKLRESHSTIFRQRETQREERLGTISERIRSRDQKCIARFEYGNRAANKFATGFARRRRLRRRRGSFLLPLAWKRLMKRELERKTTVVIYRHKSAIHRVSLRSERAKLRTKREGDCDSSGKNLRL